MIDRVDLFRKRHSCLALFMYPTWVGAMTTTSTPPTHEYLVASYCHCTSSVIHSRQRASQQSAAEPIWSVSPTCWIPT
jgi:hypothetical protein